MGIIRATTRPYYYTQLEQTPPTISKLEPLETGMISLAFRVAGTGYYLGNHQQRKLESVISPALGEKATYVRDYVTSDNRGFYTWGAQYVTTADRLVTVKRADITLRGNRVETGRFSLMEMKKVSSLINCLNEKGYSPDGDIEIIYYPVISPVMADKKKVFQKESYQLVSNLVNILGARKALIEQALSLKEPLKILITPGRGLALSISLSAFSYPAIEAAAFLIEQACKMAQATGKTRMKPCDGTNPKYQMRSWLLRLGFIGEEFERPRKTLLAGLEGDTAFFTAEQKETYMTKRRTKQSKKRQIENNTTKRHTKRQGEAALGSSVEQATSMVETQMREAV